MRFIPAVSPALPPPAGWCMLNGERSVHSRERGACMFRVFAALLAAGLLWAATPARAGEPAAFTKLVIPVVNQSGAMLLLRLDGKVKTPAATTWTRENRSPLRPWTPPARARATTTNTFSRSARAAGVSARSAGSRWIRPTSCRTATAGSSTAPPRRTTAPVSCRSTARPRSASSW